MESLENISATTSWSCWPFSSSVLGAVWSRRSLTPTKYIPYLDGEGHFPHNLSPWPYSM